MRANYKKLARKTRQEYIKDTSRMLSEIGGLLDIIRTKAQALEEKDRELDEWKTKYVQVLNMYIELQERLQERFARKEG